MKLEFVAANQKSPPRRNLPSAQRASSKSNPPIETPRFSSVPTQLVDFRFVSWAQVVFLRAKIFNLQQQILVSSSKLKINSLTTKKLALKTFVFVCVIKTQIYLHTRGGGLCVHVMILGAQTQAKFRFSSCWVFNSHRNVLLFLMMQKQQQTQDRNSPQFNLSLVCIYIFLRVENGLQLLSVVHAVLHKDKKWSLNPWSHDCDGPRQSQTIWSSKHQITHGLPEPSRELKQVFPSRHSNREKLFTS